MKKLLIETLDSWTPLPDSVLRTYTDRTDCKSIFQAVCNELGEYYKQYGFKYAKSGPHLTGLVGDIKFKIGFWSSGSNIQGEHIALELIPEFYSVSLQKSLGKDHRYIMGYQELLYKYTECPKDIDVIVRYPFDDDQHRQDNFYKNRLIISNNIELWGISEKKFVLLVNFLNRYFIEAINTLQDEKLLAVHLLEMDNINKQKIISGEARLCKYIEHTFPNLHNSVKNGLLNI